MPDPREALAAALAEQSPDDDDLRDWLTDRAEFVLDALQAGGYEVVRLAATPTGADLIAAERQRQVEEEGYDPDHDATHDDQGLAWAARCYIDAATIPADQWEDITTPPLNWPWYPEDWKPTRGVDTVRDLVRAGALIAAEIDRLNRLEVTDA